MSNSVKATHVRVIGLSVTELICLKCFNLVQSYVLHRHVARKVKVGYLFLNLTAE